MGGHLVVHAFGLCVPRCDHEKINPSQVKACEEWIALFGSKRTTVNKKRGSYGLKHVVEGWRRERGDVDPYVTNGAFITAAINLGYKLKWHEPGSPNCSFAMGTRRWDYRRKVKP